MERLLRCGRMVSSNQKSLRYDEWLPMEEGRGARGMSDGDFKESAR
jgi:hypothetical protein